MSSDVIAVARGHDNNIPYLQQLKFLLGGGIVRVFVRVKLESQYFILGLYLLHLNGKRYREKTGIDGRVSAPPKREEVS